MKLGMKTTRKGRVQKLGLASLMLTAFPDDGVWLMKCWRRGGGLWDDKSQKARIIEGKMEEAYRTCLDPSLKFLEDSTDFVDSHPHLAIPFMALRVELTFLKMLFWQLAYWDEPGYEQLRATTSDMEFGFKETLFKPIAKEICILILDEARKPVSYQQNQKMLLERDREIISFIDLIQQNIWALLNSNTEISAPVKQQIAFIQQKLDEFGRFSYPINHPVFKVKKLVELISLIRTWANHISCLVFLYWIDGNDEKWHLQWGLFFMI
ncbi:OLC1v1012783C1 [Oldenlandia corymbosa var. corymbosa]|uniref:OLC1v1012783C1 n=1 Tax=Oldenlandia corymbosa var. corymbosa TaxID=529605 RepID=A0AAV1DWP8_OLDCO|nr:OLC1v1012783C1 [Oldenlandia corymbosa var. corymbosa]